MVTALLAAALAFPHGTAVLHRAQGNLSVRVEIADTEPRRERGLMFRTRLAPRAGMAFVFPRATRGAFWMKDTRIALSVAFYDRDGRIRRIMDMAPCLATPCKLYDPNVTYRGALEVNRGAFRRWGVRRGDVVTLRRDS